MATSEVLVYYNIDFILQCFDTVGWATGRAPGLEKVLQQFPKDYFLGWLNLE